MKLLLNITLLLSALATGLSLTTVANEMEPTFLRAASRRLKAARTAEVTCESVSKSERTDDDLDALRKIIGYTHPQTFWPH